MIEEQTGYFKPGVVVITMGFLVMCVCTLAIAIYLLMR